MVPKQQLDKTLRVVAVYVSYLLVGDAQQNITVNVYACTSFAS